MSVDVRGGRGALHLRVRRAPRHRVHRPPLRSAFPPRSAIFRQPLRLLRGHRNSPCIESHCGVVGHGRVFNAGRFHSRGRDHGRSPSLLTQSVVPWNPRRFEVNPSWSGIRVLVALAFVAFAALLAYNLARALAGQQASDLAGLSEQLAMALGASLLIVRTGFRFRPRLTLGLWPIWIAATLFAIAFVVVAPYAFPAFEAVYLVSGLAGWILGAFMVSRMD